ncbi:adenylate kinase 7-like [Brachyistius frenatus]|uniref:adenylate kinase 7-like n=1 Tax=Brachyistius frenatus TaxID=100188 RepID=UPI0037E73202
MEDRKQETHPKRIFINDVDGYSSKHIAKYLSTYVAEEMSEDEDEEDSATRGEPVFQVVGTVSSSSSEDEESGCLELYTSPTMDELLQHLLECDVVVYNVSESATQQQVEEATWVLTALLAEMNNFNSRKIFILVSTVMTWAVTKPRNADETDGVISEKEFRRRRPHPSFRKHDDLERLVLNLPQAKKSKLKGYVVASGLQYGKGENLFHYFFKVSWLMQLPKVPIFGEGTNRIPMIHVYDLGGVIQNIIEIKPRLKYILAIDDSTNTLEDIVKMISDVLGPEQTHNLPMQEAIDMKAFKPEELECLNINLRLDASIVKDTFNMHWTSEVGMVNNMESIVEEYKETMRLFPVRICLVGPPAVGKTTIAEKLCHRYQIRYIKIEVIIEEKIAQLKEIVAEVDTENGSNEEQKAAQKQLDDIFTGMAITEGKVVDRPGFRILQEKLKSKPCKNQGFVLDGFPKIYEEAKVIFADEDAKNQESDSMTRIPTCNKNIIPGHIFAINASDDFLINRVQGLPESVVEKMHYTQNEFIPRLATYRQLSEAEETLLDYFHELEIHPEQIEVTTDDPEYTDVLEKIAETVGVPKNYGRNQEEWEEENRRKEEERKQTLAAEAAERKHRKEAALAEMVAQYEDWQRNLLEVTRQEGELLEARSLPLRNYLMKYVMPPLQEAMVECCKIKPDDPVDFLAEYLLQTSQQK